MEAGRATGGGMVIKGGILGVLELLSVLTVVVDPQTHTGGKPEQNSI